MGHRTAINAHLLGVLLLAWVTLKYSQATERLLLGNVRLLGCWPKSRLKGEWATELRLLSTELRYYATGCLPKSLPGAWMMCYEVWLTCLASGRWPGSRLSARWIKAIAPWESSGRPQSSTGNSTSSSRMRCSVVCTQPCSRRAQCGGVRMSMCVDAAQRGLHAPLQQACSVWRGADELRCGCVGVIWWTFLHASLSQDLRPALPRVLHPNSNVHGRPLASQASCCPTPLKSNTNT